MTLQQMRDRMEAQAIEYIMKAQDVTDPKVKRDLGQRAEGLAQYAKALTETIGDRS